MTNKLASCSWNLAQYLISTRTPDSAKQVNWTKNWKPETTHSLLRRSSWNKAKPKILGNKGDEQTNLPIRKHHQKEQFHPLTAQNRMT